MCLKTIFWTIFHFEYSLLISFTSSLFFFESLLCCRQDALTTETEVLMAVMLSEPFLFKNICYLKFTIVYFDFALLTRSHFNRSSFCANLKWCFIYIYRYPGLIKYSECLLQKNGEAHAKPTLLHRTLPPCLCQKSGQAVQLILILLVSFLLLIFLVLLLALLNSPPLAHHQLPLRLFTSSLALSCTNSSSLSVNASASNASPCCLTDALHVSHSWMMDHILALYDSRQQHRASMPWCSPSHVWNSLPMVLTVSSWVCESIAQTPQNNWAVSRQTDASVLFVGANIVGKSNNIQNIPLLQGFCFWKRSFGPAKWDG